MYNNFFGFKERPFQLVPNPGYLYLSRSHEEAIAHLKYAISHGDGFVEITGEVGTGKTTLCRAFLEDLDESTEIAYIFNPRLDSLELLRAINDEFGIPSDANSTKDLIDTLNTFLMEEKSKGKNAILLIDEAQNLDKDVLEQLRLLSNLETNTSKLLQIILVGQPELQRMLDSYELRQLRQRITLNWYLTPLSRKETKEYIRHRVNIASKKTEDKFTETAYNRIYKYSGGIPRLINIACDRALLTAFGFGREKVTGTIAKDSVSELKGGGDRTPGLFFTKGRLITGSVALLFLILVVLFQFTGQTGSEEKKEPPRTTPKTLPRAESTKETGPAGPSGPAIQTSLALGDFLGTLTNRSSRLAALKAIVSMWGTEPVTDDFLENIDDDGVYFQLAASRNNFHLLRIDNESELINKLNLPAVLAFSPPGAFAPRYLTLIKMTGGELILKGGEKNEIISVEPARVRSFWSGTAYILWRNFFNYRGSIPTDASKESVIALKMLLREIGFKEIKPDDSYDDATREAVEKIQAKHGIEVDGIVGSRTKIVIYNEKKELNIPHIRSIEK
ncbi:MAG: AAA family ATPase [bacterium]|nr:AAA family ATPase [bacterium]